MKKTLLILILAGAAAGTAFAQGRVRVHNTAATIIRYDPDPHHEPPGFPYGGQPIGGPSPPPDGGFFNYGLYVGSSSSSLLLVTTIPLNGPGTTAGYVPPTDVTLPSPFAGGTAWDFQVKIWDAVYSSFEAEQAAVGIYDVNNSDWLGETVVFTMTPGGGLVTPDIDTGGGSTMPQVPLDVLVVLPEPSVCGLAGLAAASVWVFARRRRRTSANCAK